MAYILEREYKELREKVSDLEKSLKKKQENANVFYENHAHLVWANEMKQELNKTEEEKKFLQAEIDELLGKDIYLSARQKTDFDMLRDNSILKSRVYEIEKILESERKESKEEKKRNVKQIKENGELTKKIHKAKNELTAKRKLLEKEKDKLIEVEKRFDAERKTFERKIKDL
ncbi:histone-lysine N-methyltransferase, H3 lysine-79 specific-like [Cynara cardunculus var. scolymus]|uniref:histone-lysine N-methyltransferase, H3 lysine-79 specific-like n=1 Tax=Cynara cardunculus var. scolymus TaxID=59895 RepID=UPI000D627B21|nr:histone-lysine N-methyltransferase, H3 lysine-79 specific-like [Cynara cardunculus var. scolymus]